VATPDEAPDPHLDCPDHRPLDDAKVRRHRERARRGVLRYLAREGGTLPLKDLHDHSERRWFIAHAGFSEMIEFYVEEGLVDLDPESWTVSLSDDGRRFMASSLLE